MATRSKYIKLPFQNKDQILETDIHIKSNQTYGRYVSRALTLFFGEDKKFVTIKAIERLMDKALWVAQVLKLKVPGLHQITQIKQKQIIETYVPKQQGLVRIENKKYLTVIQITLTIAPTDQQKKNVGYQTPLSAQGKQFLTKQSWQKESQQRKKKYQELQKEGKLQQKQEKPIKGKKAKKN